MHKKCISVSDTTNKQLRTLRTLLEIPTDSELIRYLVQAEINRQDGSDIDEPPAKRGGICQNDENVVSIHKLEQQLYSLTSMVSRVLTTCKDIDENTYITKDVINSYLRYLDADGSMSGDCPYVSSDSRLSLGNKANCHTYVIESLANLNELRRRRQIEAANK